MTVLAISSQWDVILFQIYSIPCDFVSVWHYKGTMCMKLYPRYSSWHSFLMIMENMCLKKIYQHGKAVVVVWVALPMMLDYILGINTRRYKWTSSIEAKYDRSSGLWRFCIGSQCRLCLHSQSRMDVRRHDVNKWV